VVAGAVCVAGVAVGDIDLHFVAGLVLGDIDLHFVWQVWHWAGLLTHNLLTQLPLTNTHLLRTVFANSDVECSGRAKTPTIN